jgi:hypothetical protein
MRTLRDLDDEIGRAERRLAARRKHLSESFAVSRSRTRVSLASPKILAAAFAVGFLLDRLGRLRSRAARSQRQASASSGIAAALAAAALRAVLGNPKLWAALRDRWARRSANAAYQPLNAPVARESHPAALERAPYQGAVPLARVEAGAPTAASASRDVADSYGIAAAQR